MRTLWTTKEEQKMTYIDYIEQWLGYKSSTLATSTVRTYSMIIRKHFRPFFKERLIEDLTRIELQQFINTLTTSQKTTIAILKTTLKELYYDELISKDLAGQLRKPLRPHKAKGKQALTREQIKALFNYLEGSQWNYLIRLMFASGLRVGELLALQWSDVLWYTKESTISQQREIDQDGYAILKVTKTFDEHSNRIHEPKTPSSVRDVIVTDRETLALLYNKWSAVGFPKDGYIAQSKRKLNQPISRVAIKDILKKATEAIQLPFLLTPHHARVNYTSHSLASGVSETNLQAQLGHTNTNLIRSVYGKAIGNRLEELIDKHNIYYFR
ncbi:MAG: tyrosine-type recombinase/integrase [Veillonella sp.]|nr:tyrosine-type recombinase/integrase [Veillonella sp.]